VISYAISWFRLPLNKGFLGQDNDEQLVEAPTRRTGPADPRQYGSHNARCAGMEPTVCQHHVPSPACAEGSITHAGTPHRYWGQNTDQRGPTAKKEYPDRAETLQKSKEFFRPTV